MQSDQIAGYRTLSTLARETGYSRTWIRRVCEQHGVKIVRHARRSWVSPAGQRKLKRLLPPRAVA